MMLVSLLAHMILLAASFLNNDQPLRANACDPESPDLLFGACALSEWQLVQALSPV